ncbi:MAG: pentapeptide repeat-containing protein [Rhodobiaceae bacterium]|nr:pentapeptide repeat-containing protein [Rhodobiaceae bacterium]
MFLSEPVAPPTVDEAETQLGIPNSDDLVVMIIVASLVHLAGFLLFLFFSAVPVSVRMLRTDKQENAAAILLRLNAGIGGLRGRPSESSFQAPPLFDGVRAAGLLAQQGKALPECVRCNLAGGDFSEAHFRLSNLREVDLRDANLAGAELMGARLIDANLEGADLTGAHMDGIFLIGANLRGANLAGARINFGWLQKTDMTGANLVGADFSRTEMAEGLNLRNADATGAKFRFARLTGVIFAGTRLAGADFSNATELTQRQLASACGDEKTILPVGLTLKPCPQ